MIKTINNKAQQAINTTIGLSSFILILGICGSLETDRINIAQCLTNLFTAVCIMFTLYTLLSYANYRLTDYIVRAYRYSSIHDNKHSKLLTKAN